MKQANEIPIKASSFAVMTLLLSCGMTQQEQKSVDHASSSGFNHLNPGVVEDWSSRHVIFSNPGTLEDAVRSGKRDERERIVTDPRYRMQWVRRYASSANLTSGDTADLQAPTNIVLPVGVFEKKWHKKEGFRSTPLHGDWQVQIGGGSDASVALGMYPAKYTFSPIAAPSCTADFVVFPINAAGNSSQQANLMGFNNLYKNICTTGTVPNPMFAYFVGTGKVQTSPTLSLDGKKIAFVETITNGSIFHVLTIGTTGSNGTAFNNVAPPCTVNGVVNCTTNNAVDRKITMSGNRTDSNSGPFVDYTNDIAYVGDDTGHLHKFTGVFLGTPTEVTTSPWPFAAAVSAMTAPVYDSSSGNIFFGTANGNLHCVVAATGANCATNLISVASGTTPGPVNDAPIVDSTNHTVFAAASNSTTSILLQATTSLGSPVRVNMGASGTDLWNGAFDNLYFTSVGTGHMYFCGTQSGAAISTLYRVGFSSTGTMNSTHDGNSFVLIANGATGTLDDCTPLTEDFNSSTGIDHLFLGVKDNGFLPNCNGNTCVMSFVITSSFPTGPTATNASFGNDGISGFIVDNDSGESGASQVYFGSLQGNLAIQVSQAAAN